LPLVCPARDEVSRRRLPRGPGAEGPTTEIGRGGMVSSSCSTTSTVVAPDCEDVRAKPRQTRVLFAGRGGADAGLVENVENAAKSRNRFACGQADCAGLRRQRAWRAERSQAQIAEADGGGRKIDCAQKTSSRGGGQRFPFGARLSCARILSTAGPRGRLRREAR